ncbi:hypothetical protein C8T65DRAFT_741103 [Cerioporus squamosus]|nr:hypothetical protein C8T65DRAFT_741103 [Cerioporus squamosus]
MAGRRLMEKDRLIATSPAPADVSLHATEYPDAPTFHGHPARSPDISTPLDIARRCFRCNPGHQRRGVLLVKSRGPQTCCPTDVQDVSDGRTNCLFSRRSKSHVSTRTFASDNDSEVFERSLGHLVLLLPEEASGSLSLVLWMKRTLGSGSRCR